MADLDPSARFYSRLMLSLYDIWVLGITNFMIWRCPTSTVLLPFFHKNIGENAHLDVGVGTGYYLAASASQFAKTKNVTLLDLNPNTLDVASARLRKAGYKGTIDTVERSVFLPLPDSLHSKFDSISTFFLLHCLPGTFPAKASHVFSNLSVGLAPGGVLYGSTVLTHGVTHNWAGRLLLRFYNYVGAFGNTEDDAVNLERALKGCFEEVNFRLVGSVALFEGRKPIRK